MPKPWRLLNSGLNSPFYNMALDEALLLNYLKEKVPTLRLYGWQTLSLSLGFSQCPERVIDIPACRRKNIPFVRRMTGGGVLPHADEITYSIVCSKDDLDLPFSLKASFRLLCSFIIRFYAKLSLKAYFSRDGSSLRPLGQSEFCLSTCQDYDILIDGKKIGGNAQRRKKDLILQQGSLPLSFNIPAFKDLIKEDISGLKDRTTSLYDICPARPDLDVLHRLLIESFIETFSCQLFESQAADYEQAAAVDLEETKYSSDSWNLNNAQAILVK